MTEEGIDGLTFWTFFLYVAGAVSGFMFLVFFVMFCLYGPGCITIYNKLSHMYYLLETHESAPLIVESEYFPRPRYDGYCLLGQEDPPPPALASSSDIDQGCSQSEGLDTPASVHFPKGILAPQRERTRQGKRRTRPEDSPKSVTFNHEFQVV